MTQNQRYTITAALPYTNGPFTLAICGVLMPSDILSLPEIARKRRFVCLEATSTVYFHEKPRKKV
jgi:hypothetical protein